MSDQSKKPIIFTATKEQLTCKQCYLRLWLIAVSLTHLTSGKWIIAIEEFFRDLDVLGIEIRHPNGQLYHVPYIFELFPDENEAGRRWMSLFLQADNSGMRPRRMCRDLRRLEAIAFYLEASVSSFSQVDGTDLCSLTHRPLGS